ncbi:MAG: hypothetical protein HYX93_02840 [Chloroflexi bacterium]|nr:hypothetical protein [Chloroflexota bacterium]
MEFDFKVPERADPPEGGKDAADRVLAHALLISAGAHNDLAQAKSVRAEAERARERAEAEAARALEDLFADANAQAQSILEEARAVKAQAEAELARARKEMEKAVSSNAEAERRSEQMEAEAKDRAEKLVRDGMEQAAELKRRAEEEMRRILVEVATMHAAAQEEMEAQRILADAARIRARVSRLQEQSYGSTSQSGRGTEVRIPQNLEPLADEDKDGVAQPVEAYGDHQDWPDDHQSSEQAAKPEPAKAKARSSNGKG